MVRVSSPGPYFELRAFGTDPVLPLTEHATYTTYMMYLDMTNRLADSSSYVVQIKECQWVTLAWF